MAFSGLNRMIQNARRFGSQSEASDKTKNVHILLNKYCFLFGNINFIKNTTSTIAHETLCEVFEVTQTVKNSYHVTKTFDKFAFEIFRSNGQFNDSLCTWAMISVRKGIAKTKFTMLDIAHDAAFDLWSEYVTDFVVIIL